jgi:S-adenosylhomocysteine hydrolase
MEKLPKKVSPPPNKIQNQISKLALQAFGLDIDNLTLQQKEYFKS